MNYTTHSLTQGDAAWHAHRSTHFNGSEAPAAQGISSYKTRNELLKEKATGITPEIDAATQKRFDDGHAFEAATRPFAEEIIGEELYPATVSAEVEGLPLSSSLDGMNMAGTILWENKSLNKALAASLAQGVIPDEYHPQMEQALLITGAEKFLFTASNGDKESMLHAWYFPNPNTAQTVIRSWAQFKADLAAYVPTEAAAPVVAAPVESLPAVSVQMNGAIAVISNLDLFGAKLKEFIANIDKNPSTDQAFADADNAIKILKKAEDALQQAEESALAQTSSIEEMRRTVKDCGESARTTRLLLEKIVKTRKDQIRVEIQQKASAEFTAHIATINKRLAKVTLPPILADFAGVMKGKKTITGVQGAVDDELARVKIEANAIAEKLDANLATLRELASDHAFLFADTQQIIGKENADLVLLIKSRIAEHAAKQEAAAEAQRERIREEERKKLEREQEAQRLADAKAAEIPPQATETASATAGPTTPAPQAAVAPMAAVTSKVTAMPQRTPSKNRPSDDEIISVLALHFRVHEMKVIEWMLEFNPTSASERASKEFA